MSTNAETNANAVSLLPNSTLGAPEQAPQVPGQDTVFGADASAALSLLSHTAQTLPMSTAASNAFPKETAKTAVEKSNILDSISELPEDPLAIARSPTLPKSPPSHRASQDVAVAISETTKQSVLGETNFSGNPVSTYSLDPVVSIKDPETMASSTANASVVNTAFEKDNSDHDVKNTANDSALKTLTASPILAVQTTPPGPTTAITVAPAMIETHVSSEAESAAKPVSNEALDPANISPAVTKETAAIKTTTVVDLVSSTENTSTGVITPLETLQAAKSPNVNVGIATANVVSSDPILLSELKASEQDAAAVAAHLSLPPAGSDVIAPSTTTAPPSSTSITATAPPSSISATTAASPPSTSATTTASPPSISATTTAPLSSASATTIAPPSCVGTTTAPTPLPSSSTTTTTTSNNIQLLLSESPVIRETVHGILALLQTYGPLTAAQLEYNLPPIKQLAASTTNDNSNSKNPPVPTIRLIDILEILVTIGIVQVVAETATINNTDETNKGSNIEMSQTVDKNTKSSSHSSSSTTRRYCVCQGVPRADVVHPRTILQEIHAAHTETERSWKRQQRLREVLLALSPQSSGPSANVPQQPILVRSFLQGLLTDYPEILDDPVYVTALRNCQVDIGDRGVKPVNSNGGKGKGARNGGPGGSGSKTARRTSKKHSRDSDSNTSGKSGKSVKLQKSASVGSQNMSEKAVATKVAFVKQGPMLTSITTTVKQATADTTNAAVNMMPTKTVVTNSTLSQPIAAAQSVAVMHNTASKVVKPDGVKSEGDTSLPALPAGTLLGNQSNANQGDVNLALLSGVTHQSANSLVKTAPTAVLPTLSVTDQEKELRPTEALQKNDST